MNRTEKLREYRKKYNQSEKGKSRVERHWRKRLHIDQYIETLRLSLQQGAIVLPDARRIWFDDDRKVFFLGTLHQCMLRAPAFAAASLEDALNEAFKES